MANEIEFVVVNELELKARISSIADRVAIEIMKSMGEVNNSLRTHIMTDKLSGQVLHSRKGNLKRNILQIPATIEGNTIAGGVALGANAPYGLAHEYGASIPERVPTKHKSLHWIGKSGEEVFAMRARAFVLPERSFMRSSFREFRDQIEDAMRAAVVRGSEAE
jgi:hypothetical protein